VCLNEEKKEGAHCGGFEVQKTILLQLEPTCDRESPLLLHHPALHLGPTVLQGLLHLDFINYSLQLKNQSAMETSSKSWTGASERTGKDFISHASLQDVLQHLHPLDHLPLGIRTKVEESPWSVDFKHILSLSVPGGSEGRKEEIRNKREK